MDGCTQYCRPAPTGAVIYDGSSELGKDECPWTCMQGWHISDDGLSCLQCALETSCSQGFVLVDTSKYCLPTSRSYDLCKPCDPVTGGRPRSWDNLGQVCTYECLSGYFAANEKNTSCLPCDVYNAQECPVGFFRDYDGCVARGTPPLCRPCAAPEDPNVLDRYVFSFTSNGGLNASNCSATCGAGFHSLAGGQYVQEPVNVFNLQCVLCKPWLDDVTCHGACQVGQFRNKSVADGLARGACVQCMTSSQCGAGRYAIPCSGNESANAGCRDCSSELLFDGGISEQVRDFVSYELQRTMAQQLRTVVQPPVGDCPRVCKPNHILVAGGACVTCRSWVLSTKGCQQEPAPPLLGQPQACDFVYSHWNATPGPMWWASESTPSFLKAFASKYSANRAMVPRAELCWACPYGEGTIEGDTDLCTLLPGFGRATELLKLKQVKIPVLGPDIYLSIQEPPMPNVDLGLIDSKQNGRRLLLLGQPRASSLTNAIISARPNTVVGAPQTTTNVQCQVGYYKDRHGDGSCYSCPTGTSTSGVGAVSLQSCLCKPGWSRMGSLIWSRGCLPCPPDTFTESLTPQGGDMCRACPPNETTFGQEGMSACACRWGMMRVAPQTCAPCPANTYCRPCMESETCPTNRVIMGACFAGASAAPGSTGVGNCTCGSGLGALQRANGQYYCSPIPPMATYDADLRRIACVQGYKETWNADRSQLLSCTLCEVGFYASTPIFPTLHCRPCPVGFYAGTRDVIGNCTACPFFLSTVGTGSTSIRDCGCPPPMVAGASGGCVGCRADQYSLGGVCKTCPLYSMGRAGGSSLNDCQCVPGYTMTADGVCSRCEVGTFSAFAGSKECTACPRGSSTADRGSSSIRQCSVCLGDYVWMDKMGCVPRSLTL